MLQDIRFAIIITSDRAANGIRPDTTGPKLFALIQDNGGTCHSPIVIPDDSVVIKETILQLSNRADIDVILTSGGTGIGPRDVTVDVTRSLIEKEMPGFGEEMRRRSMEVTPYGILSRATAGALRNTFILNLPGSPQGAVDCLNWVLKPLRHLVRVLKKTDTECPIQPISTTTKEK